MALPNPREGQEDGYMFKVLTVSGFHPDRQTPTSYEITYMGIPIKP